MTDRGLFGAHFSQHDAPASDPVPNHSRARLCSRWTMNHPGSPYDSRRWETTFAKQTADFVSISVPSSRPDCRFVRNGDRCVTRHQCFGSQNSRFNSTRAQFASRRDHPPSRTSLLSYRIGNHFGRTTHSTRRANHFSSRNAHSFSRRAPLAHRTNSSTRQINPPI